MSGGPKAGVNISNFMGDSLDDNKFKVGFNLGGFVNYGFSDNLSIQGEILFSSKGAKFKTHSESTILGTTTISDGNETVNINYMDIPVLFQYKLETGSYFNVGIQPSFAISIKDSWEYTYTSGSTTQTFSGTKTDKDSLNLQSMDIGALIGTGYQSESGLNFCLRAGFGFTNVFDDESSTADDDYIEKNLCLQASIGWAFGDTGGRGGKRRR